MGPTVPRRPVIGGVLGGALALPFPARRGSAAGPIPLGALSSLTGEARNSAHGSAHGPAMAKVARALTARINRTGGVLGRPIALILADDRADPAIGRAAAARLITENRAVAIVGAASAAVAIAAAPLCWRSRTMLLCAAGADAIIRLPHQGYILCTRPGTALRSARAAGFLLQREAKNVSGLSARAPAAAESWKRLAAALERGGAQARNDIVYDPARTMFRSEIEKSLAAQPDTLFLDSFAPDLEILLREIRVAGFAGNRLAPARAATAAVLRALPAAATDGLWSFAPSPDVASPAYRAVQGILGIAEPDPGACQIYDHIALVALAIARAGTASGVAIRDDVRRISQGGGEKVSDPVAGIRLLAAGREVDYDGASGPCDFTAAGDVARCKFIFRMAEARHNRTLFIT